MQGRAVSSASPEVEFKGPPEKYLKLDQNNLGSLWESLPPPGLSIDLHSFMAHSRVFRLWAITCLKSTADLVTLGPAWRRACTLPYLHDTDVTTGRLRHVAWLLRTSPSALCLWAIAGPKSTQSISFAGSHHWSSFCSVSPSHTLSVAEEVISRLL